MHPCLKQKHYGNCKVFSPEGILMFRCNEKRINWYLDRGLAEKIDDISIKLLFQPKGLGKATSIYHLGEKPEICVVCGSGSFLTKHHCVPFRYRKYFPLDKKEHDCYDIFLLCRECHEKYEEKALALQEQIAKELGIPANSQSCAAKNGKLFGICKSLAENWHNIPQKRREELAKYVEEHQNTKITEQNIFEIWQSIPKSKQTMCFDHGKYVAEHISIEDFCQRWRRHFVESMHPKFLPKYWKTDKQV